jgi:putative ABC transport system permease protein
VILLGRYEGADQVAQILRPVQVMDELLETILTIQSYVLAAVAVLAVATLATAALVFWLGVRLRRRELETLWKIGGSRSAVAGVLVSEVVVVLVLAAATAAGLTALTSRFGSAAIRMFLLS